MSKTIAGGLIGKALGAYGTKPVIPELPGIDPSTIQQMTAAGNLAVLPQAQALASAVNQGNAAQLRAILNRGGQLDLAEKFVNSQLRGELSQDVQRSLGDSAASKALGLGLGGQGFQVGLDSLFKGREALAWQQQGFQNFGALSRLTTPNLMGPESMFFTPQQRLDFSFQDRNARFERDLLQAQVAAAPNPADVALAEGFDNFFAFWASVGGAALGGAGGGSALTTKGNPGVGQSAGPGYMGVSQPSGSNYTGSDFSGEFLTQGSGGMWGSGGGGGGGWGSGAL